jgi:lipid-binding SYLF domain-containing protein
MLTRKGFLGATAVLAASALGAPVARAAQSSQQETIDGARKVLADLRHDKAFGNAKQLMRQAKAVLIVPKLLKGGFIVGGEGGNGVLMVQHKVVGAIRRSTRWVLRPSGCRSGWSSRR